jgi:glycosyltransferase involved in cell wall biosynthesis
MLEPLGQSQVIGYIERLSRDFALHLISFEKPADLADRDKLAPVAERLARAGIAWRPLTYHKRPTVPATLFDIAHGTLVALWLTLRHRLRLVHARSYVAALMGMAVKRLTGARLLFDMRGLWADERVEGGLWPTGGAVYRAAKRIERSLLRAADRVVTLTEASVPVLERLAADGGREHLPITVIPTCANLERFKPDGAARPERFTLGYVGSIGTIYLFDEVLACFDAIRQRRPDARLLVVNRNDQALVRAKLADHGLAAEQVELVAADHAEVPALVRRMSAGIGIYRPDFSRVATAPTKLAEYLGCGVPCLGNTGVGDIAFILEHEGGGVTLHDFSAAERSRAVDRLLAMCDDPATTARCRAVALKHFSIDSGVERYRAIYRELAG